VRRKRDLRQVRQQAKLAQAIEIAPGDLAGGTKHAGET
jgi:hypothetical protein